MNNSWAKMIKITGYVGIFGFLFTILMNHIFNEKIVELVGSENTFFIIMALIVIFAIGMAIALLRSQQPSVVAPSQMDTSGPPSAEKDPSKKEISIAYNNNATHNGNNTF